MSPLFFEIFWKCLWAFRGSPLSTLLCVFRKPYHHAEENPAHPVVSWPLDMWILLIPSNRLFSAGPGEHDGAPAYKGITVTGACIHMCFFSLHKNTRAYRVHKHYLTKLDFEQDFPVLTTYMWLCFSPCRCCLLERLLIPATFPPSMELFSVGGEKLIDSSRTTPPSVPLSRPSQSFKTTMLPWQKKIYPIYG